jgi:hypothetical protein
MRNPIPKSKRKKYFASDIHPCVRGVDARIVIHAHYAHSFRNCVLGLLRVVKLGFRPSLAREARCIPVFSHIEFLEQASFAIGRRGKLFTYMLPDLEKYRPILRDRQWPREREDEVMHFVFRSMENAADIEFKTDSTQLALKARGDFNASASEEVVELNQPHLQEEFARQATDQNL